IHRKAATFFDCSGLRGGGAEEMFKFLKGVVGGSGTGLKDLPYNIGDPYPSAWGSWNHFRGTSKVMMGLLFSIFSLSGNDAQDGHLAAGRNGVKRLRTVRHPNILSFLHSTEVETHDGSTSKVTIYIVTEPVMPLSDKIKELGLKSTQRDEYFALGLHQITKAVSFLNNDCNFVVVTPTLDWKLHAFDVLSEFDGSNESASGPMLLGKTEELRNTVGIPKSLLPDYQRLLSSMPSRRLNTSKLLENGVLKRTLFFRKLPNVADSFLARSCLRSCCPCINCFTQDGSWLSAEDFKVKSSFLLPMIELLEFSLLQHVDQFGESMSGQIVDEQVDEEPAIRTNTTILLGNIATYLNEGRGSIQGISGCRTFSFFRY
ncbi:hypothetical protein HID58_057810, partial [Brassica napus]